MNGKSPKRAKTNVYTCVIAPSLFEGCHAISSQLENPTTCENCGLHRDSHPFDRQTYHAQTNFLARAMPSVRLGCPYNMLHLIDCSECPTCGLLGSMHPKETLLMSSMYGLNCTIL